MNEIAAQPTATLPARLRELPDGRWVDRLFARLAAIYGALWLDRWRDVPIADVKDEWQESLGVMYGIQISAALDHVAKHNPFPPTLPEFYIIAGGMAKPFLSEPPRIEHKREPEREFSPAVKSAISEIGVGKRDKRAWARKILAAPSNYPSISVQFAREAMGILPEGM